MINVFDTFHIILKLFVSFVSIVAMLRWMGRKEMKQSTPLQFCLLVIIGGVVSILATGPQYSVLEIIVIVFAWFAMIYVVDYLKSKFPKFRHLIQGRSKVIVNEGQVIWEELEKERMSLEELNVELRERGIFGVDDVKIAVMEINGKVTAIPKETSDSNEPPK